MNQACHGIKPLLENICAKSYAKIAQTNLIFFFQPSDFLLYIWVTEAECLLWFSRENKIKYMDFCRLQTFQHFVTSFQLLSLGQYENTWSRSEKDLLLGF